MTKIRPKKKLTEAQTRVLIAKDALKYLKAGKISSEQEGHFLRFPFNSDFKSPLINNKTKLDTVLKKIKEVCDVCAIGSLFYSMVRRFDGVDISVVEYINSQYTSPCVNGDSTRDKLVVYFTPKQINLIEYAFEGFSTKVINEEDRIIAQKYHNEVINYNRNERMTNILKNIIKNKGEFVP